MGYLVTPLQFVTTIPNACYTRHLRQRDLRDGGNLHTAATRKASQVRTISLLAAKYALIEDNRHDFSRSFDVLVGPEKKRFSVVHDILTARSGFFEASRSARWKKDSSIPTDLSDHDPQEFSDYLALIYTGDLSCSDATLSQWYIENCPDEDERWAEIGTAHVEYLQNLASLYVLADKLDDPVSANLIIDKFVKIYDDSGNILLPSLATWIYEHTPPKSPLRNVVLDTLFYESGIGYFESGMADNLPHSLLLEMAREHFLVRDRNLTKTVQCAYPCGVLKTRSKCHYHQHNDRHPECK